MTSDDPFFDARNCHGPGEGVLTATNLGKNLPDQVHIACHHRPPSWIKHDNKLSPATVQHVLLGERRHCSKKTGKHFNKIQPLTTNLSAALTREIGRVIVHYAALEHDLSAITYLVLGLSRAQGRLAVRAPRATERLDLIQDLLGLRKIKVSFNFQGVHKSLEKCSARRDAIAHGVWSIHPRTDTPVLQITKAQWTPVPLHKTKIKRFIIPEGRLFDITECRELLDLIKRTAVQVDALARDVERRLREAPQL